MYRLLWLLLFVAGSARASDSWIECYVGRGGLDSAEAVYKSAVEAVARHDVAALMALAPDRCGVFRSVKHHGPAAFEHFDMLSAQWSDALTALRALLAIEGVAVETLTTPEPNDLVGGDEEWEGATLIVTADPERQRVVLRVTTMAIDGRWYLWRPPTVDLVRDSAFLRQYQRIAARLDKQARLHATETALLAAIANWYKVESTSIAQVQAALPALPRHLRAEMAKVSARLGLDVGASDTDEVAVLSALAPVFPIHVRSTGLTVCDDYLRSLVDCLSEHEESLETLQSIAMALYTRRDDGDDDDSDGDLAEDCRQLGEVVRVDGCSEVMP